MNRKIKGVADIADGLWIATQVVIAILWLFGVIHWPWYWLLAPVIFTLTAVILGSVMLLIVQGLAKWLDW